MPKEAYSHLIMSWNLDDVEQLLQFVLQFGLTRMHHGVAKRSGESSPHVNRVVPALAVMRQRRIIPVLLEIRRQTVSFAARQVLVVRYWAKIA